MINSSLKNYNLKAIMSENIKPFLLVLSTTSTPLYMWFKDYATPIVVFASSLLGALYMFYNFKMKKLEYDKAKRRYELEERKNKNNGDS